MKVDQRQLNYSIGKSSLPSIVSTSEPDFFIIVKNHRQSRIRKYLRKVRKQAQQQKKLEQAQSYQTLESQRNCILNYNMLKQESLWQILIDYEKIQFNSETQQSGYIVKSKQEIVKQFIRRLPIDGKGSLWKNDFTDFKYQGP